MIEVTFNIDQNKRGSGDQSKLFISREWFSKMLLSMDEAVIVTDKEGIVTSMNRVAEELTGWSVVKSVGLHVDSIFNAINEHTRLPIENPIIRALQENKATLLSNHTILIKKDKTQRFIVDSAVPIHDDDSKVIGGALIFRDVTELSVSKKKLIKSEGLLKGIMDNTSLVIQIKDLEGNYLFINRQKEKLFNIQASNLVGKDWELHLSEEEVAESKRTHLLVIKQNCLIEYERVIKHPDGALHNYHTSKFPLYDGENNMYAVCAISTDITESKKNAEMKEKLAMQEVILKSELQYDELTRNMPNMFFSLDRFLKYTSFNKACENFTGRQASQVIGRTMEEVFPGGVPLFKDEYKEVLKTGNAKSFTSTFSIEESTFTYTVNIYPTEKGVSVLMTDLTNQKKSENEMLDLVYRLQQKNKELRQFAYTVSHDLRAPVARVLGLVSLAGIDPGFKINDKTILENVANEITILDNVVKDMNSSISIHDEEKKREYVSFEAKLKLIIKLLENEIIESKTVITFEFQNPAGIVTVRSYLYSIMYNLLSNAIKYRMPDVPLTVHVETQQDAEFICLSVKDTGMGIDMKKNGDKIFGLYNRFHGKKIEGKGIGLNLVKTHVEALGGKVEVISKVNHGSTFKIFLPVNHNKDEAS